MKERQRRRQPRRRLAMHATEPPKAGFEEGATASRRRGPARVSYSGNTKGNHWRGGLGVLRAPHAPPRARRCRRLSPPHHRVRLLPPAYLVPRRPRGLSDTHGRVVRGAGCAGLRPRIHLVAAHAPADGTHAADAQAGAEADRCRVRRVFPEFRTTGGRASEPARRHGRPRQL